MPSPISSPFKTWLGLRVSTNLIRRLIAMKDIPRFEAIYGDFHIGESYKSHAIGGVPNESGQIRGELVYLLDGIRSSVKSLLLPGEKNIIKPIFAELLGIPVAAITTAGLAEDMDWQWDFEKPPPGFGQFDCIVSQAMLEHLIDPYMHMRDLEKHLAPAGYLIVHSVTPGFDYHRYPVDCVRFFPDWFEEVGKRLKLDVEKKFFDRGHITYMYRKPG
jgi:SAM-dependent methyltransferase